ncbi:MAG: glucose-6-phosphate dehydrogenase [Gemmatimonadota bacterium]
MAADPDLGRRRIRAPRTGLGPSLPADPCVMVIFGAGGDLTRRQLIPSLYELATKGMLPTPFAVVAFSRGDRDDDLFRELMRPGVEEECALREGSWRELASAMYYVAGDFGSADDFATLAARVREVREERGIPDNVFFHMAAPPSFFETIVRGLDGSGLARSTDGWRRIVIEKPFGEDRASAEELDREVRAVFEEKQVYRIDHYLGKETVQNMLVFRFANPGFEPIWNRNFVDHVQITAAEDVGVGTRGAFYERTGIVRDMVQNHLLQLLCLTAIEPPVGFEADSVRAETVKVLDGLAVTPFDPKEDAVRGQYGPGTVDGVKVAGYREEVEAASTTPTFAAVRLTLDNWRWAGVPFYLRTGKRLHQKRTQVTVHFRPTPHFMFPGMKREDLGANVLAFRLQPEEGIIHRFLAKRPGPEVSLTPVTMDFAYADAFGVKEPPRAYAWLLMDVMQGDQHLFARADWIEKAWSLVDPLVDHWADTPPEDFPNYAAGTRGPDAAEELLARDGRRWSEL